MNTQKRYARLALPPIERGQNVIYILGYSLALAAIAGAGFIAAFNFEAF